jgi:hypothetical protein
MKVSTVVSTLVIAAWAAAALGAVPQPLSPAGTIDNREPTFRWTDTGAAKFTLELVRDEDTATTYTADAPKFEYPAKLRVGLYRWRVKEGGLSSASPWSAPLSFTFLPDTPNPKVPLNSRIAGASDAPGLYWDGIDPDATRFSIQMFRDGDLLGSMSVLADKAGPLANWPDILPAGSYAWRIRAVRKTGDAAFTLSSPWSALAPFTIGVPLSSSIIRPLAGASLSIGIYGVNMVWSSATGADSYKLDLLRNGSLLESHNYAATNITPITDWTPGRYAMIITPSNGYGRGSASVPRHFVVPRVMTPGHDQSLAVPSNRLAWSRSADCTSYRLRLYKAMPPNGDYQFLQEESIPQPLGQPTWKHWGAVSAEAGSYKWQITDFKNDKPLYTSTDYFAILSPGRPDALNPTGKKIAGLYGLRFAWKQPSGAPTRYQFQLWRNGVLLKDSGFKPSADFDKGVSLTLTYNLTEAGAGDYLWRVRAKNSDGIGGWTESRHKIAALAKPVITSPAAGATYPMGTLIAIRWPSVPGAAHYTIEFWQSGTAHTVHHAATPDTTQTLPWNVGNGEFTYRIRAGDAGYSAWSDNRIITGT